MSAPCSGEFLGLAEELGGIDCATANPVVALRAPWELANWTLPVVELLMIGGAALGLAHAVIMWRRHRQAGWLCLWIATVLYVLALEPFLYFPESFGLGDSVGLVFAHNVFSIEFLYDRLPLYIVALYPAGIYLAHLLVDRLGVFRRHGIIVGAIATGVVHHAFYEIFDHLGPQLRWWAWNPDAPSTGPLFASVPLTSMVIFAAIGPIVVVALGRWLLFKGQGDAGDSEYLGAARSESDSGLDVQPQGRTAVSWVWRSAATGVMTPLLVPILSLPVSIVDADTNTALAITLFWAELLLFVAVGVWAVITSRPTGTNLTGLARNYPAIHSLLYLAVFAILWLTAAPELLGASNGLTDSGTPTGNPVYVLGCFAFCIWVVVRALRAHFAEAVEARVAEPAGRRS